MLNVGLTEKTSVLPSPAPPTSPTSPTPLPPLPLFSPWLSHEWTPENLILENVVF
jgi:hypothetical protein